MWTAFFAWTAGAAPLAWRWDAEQERRYALDAAFTSPYIMWLMEEQNHEVRVWRVAVQMVVTCKPTLVLPKERGWEIRCDIDDASFFASPIQEDEGRAAGIVAESEPLLESGHLTWRLTPDGKITAVELHGLDESTPRQRAIVDHLEHFVERAVAALDSALPVDDAPTWKRRAPLIAQLPTATAPVGSISATFQVAGEAPDGVLVAGKVEGSLAFGADYWAIEGKQRQWFDPVDGSLSRSEIALESARTSAEGVTHPVPLVLSAHAVRLGPEDQVTLLPSAPW